MESSQTHELPRIQIVAPDFSPAAELLRWVCESRKLTYIQRKEEIRQPIAPNQVRLESSEGTFNELGPALEFIDRRCRSGERVFGESCELRQQNRALLDQHLKETCEPAIQLWFSHSMPANSIPRGCDSRQFNAETARTAINDSFAKVESQLSSNGKPFLSGDTPGFADVMFASFAFPLVLPDESDGLLPKLETLPTTLKNSIEEFRARQAGQLALTVYRNARAPRQPKLSAYPYGPTMFERLLNPFIVRRGAQLLVKWIPRFQLGNRLIVSNWQNVTEVLDRDNDFLIAPVNGARIDAVSGPFILGMDRSPELMEQREHVYSAVHDADRQRFKAALETEPIRLLDAAIQSGGKIDVVNGYARLVACRTAATFFGIFGPTEQDLLRVIRSIFQETFLNQENNQLVTERGVAAGAEFRKWIEDEMNRRIREGVLGDDVLGRLLASTGNNRDEARYMLSGMQVGAVDTTATVVANIIAEIVSDASLKETMTRDVDDPRRLRGWCWEALRRRPHNAGMIRHAGRHAMLGGKSVPEGTEVLLLTVGAMHDPAAFDDPNSLRPDRPLDRYLHFGRGLHQCTGRDLNAIQVPKLVRELLLRDVSSHSAIRTRGPFPDELIVNIRQVQSS